VCNTVAIPCAGDHITSKYLAQLASVLSIKLLLYIQKFILSPIPGYSDQNCFGMSCNFFVNPAVIFVLMLFSRECVSYECIC